MNLIFGNFVVGTSVINRFCQLDSFDRYGFQTNREISAFKQKEALQKPPLPSRMEQNCSVRLFLTTPECAVFFASTIVRCYYDSVCNLDVL